MKPYSYRDRRRHIYGLLLLLLLTWCGSLRFVSGSLFNCDLSSTYSPLPTGMSSTGTCGSSLGPLGTCNVVCMNHYHASPSATSCDLTGLILTSQSCIFDPYSSSSSSTATVVSSSSSSSGAHSSSSSSSSAAASSSSSGVSSSSSTAGAVSSSSSSAASSSAISSSSAAPSSSSSSSSPSSSSSAASSSSGVSSSSSTAAVSSSSLSSSTSTPSSSSSSAPSSSSAAVSSSSSGVSSSSATPSSSSSSSSPSSSSSSAAASSSGVSSSSSTADVPSSSSAPSSSADSSSSTGGAVSSSSSSASSSSASPLSSSSSSTGADPSTLASSSTSVDSSTQLSSSTDAPSSTSPSSSSTSMISSSALSSSSMDSSSSSSTAGALSSSADVSSSTGVDASSSSSADMSVSSSSSTGLILSSSSSSTSLEISSSAELSSSTGSVTTESSSSSADASSSSSTSIISSTVPLSSTSDLSSSSSTSDPLSSALSSTGVISSSGELSSSSVALSSTSVQSSTSELSSSTNDISSTSIASSSTNDLSSTSILSSSTELSSSSVVPSSTTVPIDSSTSDLSSTTILSSSTHLSSSSVLPSSTTVPISSTSELSSSVDISSTLLPSSSSTSIEISSSVDLSSSSTGVDSSSVEPSSSSTSVLSSTTIDLSSSTSASSSTATESSSSAITTASSSSSSSSSSASSSTAVASSSSSTTSPSSSSSSSSIGSSSTGDISSSADPSSSSASTGDSSSCSSSSSSSSTGVSSTGVSSSSSSSSSTSSSSSSSSSSTGADDAITQYITASSQSIATISPPISVPINVVDPCTLRPGFCLNHGICQSTVVNTTVGSSTHLVQLSCSCPKAFFGPHCEVGILACTNGCISCMGGNTTLSVYGVGLRYVHSLLIGGHSVTSTHDASLLTTDSRVMSEISTLSSGGPWDDWVLSDYTSMDVITFKTISFASLKTAVTHSYYDPNERMFFLSGRHESTLFDASATPTSTYEPLVAHAIFASNTSSIPIEIPYQVTSVYYAVSTCVAGEFQNSDGDCIPCPEGCACPGGGRCWTLPGYWSYSQSSLPIKCTIPEDCPGVVTTSSSGSTVFVTSGTTVDTNTIINTQVCSTGYSGVACVSCADNYYQINARCYSCGTPDDQTGQMISILIAAASVTIGLSLGVALLNVKRLVQLVSFFNVVQLLAATGQSGAQNIPGTAGEALATFFSYISVVNFDLQILHPGCTVPTITFLTIFWATMGLVVFNAFLFTLACLLRYYVRLWRERDNTGLSHEQQLALTKTAIAESKKNMRKAALMSHLFHTPAKQDYRRRLFHSYLILGTIFYLQLTTRMIKMYQCTLAPNPQSPFASVPENESYYLTADYQTPCYSGAHLITIIFVTGLFVLYSFGFPFAIFVILCRTFAQPNSTGVIGWLYHHFKLFRPQQTRKEELKEAYKLMAAEEQAAKEQQHHSHPQTVMPIEDDKDRVRKFSDKDHPSTMIIDPALTGLYIEHRRVQMFGYLFLSIRNETFPYRLLAIVINFFFALITCLVTHTITQLFLLGLCFAIDALIVSWYMPYVAWYNNVRACSIAIFSLGHSVLMIGIQSDATRSAYFYNGLWIFIAICICLAYRNRVIHWLNARFGSSAAVVNKDGEIQSGGSGSSDVEPIHTGKVSSNDFPDGPGESPADQFDRDLDFSITGESLSARERRLGTHDQLHHNDEDDLPGDELNRDCDSQSYGSDAPLHPTHMIVESVPAFVPVSPVPKLKLPDDSFHPPITILSPSIDTSGWSLTDTSDLDPSSSDDSSCHHSGPLDRSSSHHGVTMSTHPSVIELSEMPSLTPPKTNPLFPKMMSPAPLHPSPPSRAFNFLSPSSHNNKSPNGFVASAISNNTTPRTGLAPPSATSSSTSSPRLILSPAPSGTSSTSQISPPILSPTPRHHLRANSNSRLQLSINAALHNLHGLRRSPDHIDPASSCVSPTNAGPMSGVRFSSINVTYDDEEDGDDPELDLVNNRQPSRFEAIWSSLPNSMHPTPIPSPSETQRASRRRTFIREHGGVTPKHRQSPSMEKQMGDPTNQTDTRRVRVERVQRSAMRTRSTDFEMETFNPAGLAAATSLSNVNSRRSSMNMSSMSSAVPSNVTSRRSSLNIRSSTSPTRPVTDGIVKIKSFLHQHFLNPPNNPVNPGTTSGLSTPSAATSASSPRSLAAFISSHSRSPSRSPQYSPRASPGTTWRP